MAFAGGDARGGDHRPRRPGGAAPRHPAGTGPAAGEVLIRVRAAGVNRPDAAQRAGATRRRPAPPTCRGWRWRARWPPSARAGRWRRRRGLRPAARRGLRRVRADPPGPCAAGARAHGHGGGGRALRDLLHRLGQRLRPRPSAGGRELARARRLVAASARRPSSWRRRAGRGSSPPPARRRSARPAARSARSWRSTTASEDFVAAVREVTGGRGVDVILDMVGGEYVPRDVAALAPDGRLVMIAHQHGAGWR